MSDVPVPTSEQIESPSNNVIKFPLGPKKSPKANPADTNQGETPYLGDLQKTAILDTLCRVPSERRDDDWKNKFLANLPTASFKDGKPQVIVGPDGFPYFQLHFPNHGEPFQCFVIEKMLGYLLKNGVGIAINPANNNPDWVLSYGDILNLYLNGNFYSKTSVFHGSSKNNFIAGNTKMFIGDPAEKILPINTRKVLRNFLTNNGVHSPKVFIGVYEKNGKMGKDLFFNITPENLPNENLYHSIFKSILWYLPRDYSIVGVSEKNFPGQFKDL